MANEKISALPQGLPTSGSDLLALTQGWTGGNTGTTRKSSLAAMALGMQGVYNVVAYGAKGDGTTVDTVAIQAACDAAKAAGGGMILLPGGKGTRYVLNMPIILATNCTFWAPGHATLTTVVGTSFQKNPRATYFPAATTNIALFIQNEKATYPINYSDIDSNISIEGVTFDFGNYGGGAGSGSALSMVGVNGLTLIDCIFYAGPSANVPTGRMGDALASMGCQNVTLDGCEAYWFRNCCFDFWSSPKNVTMLSCVAESVDGVQLVNFNPDTEPSVGGYQPNQVADGFTMMNCRITCTGASSQPVQIERLSGSSTGSYVSNVVLMGNTFNNILLVLRGDVRGADIMANTFRGFAATNTNVIRAHPQYGSSGTAFNLVGNIINDPGTAAGQGGAILLDTANSTCTANTVTGTSYTGEPFGQGTSGNAPNQYGNFFEKSGITGRMHQGFIFTNPNDTIANPRSCIGWEDLSGGILRMYMNGDFWGFFSTDGTGAPRQVFSLQAHSSQQLSVLIGTVFTGFLRIGVGTGLTATGSIQSNALALTANNNDITTVASGTGVLLPAGTSVSNVGLEVTVWNNGANPLKIYPPISAQIDGLGLNVPDIIYPGACKSYEGISAALYRTKGGNVLATSQVANAVGTTQGTATALGARTAFLTTATSQYSARLPVGKAGMQIQIVCTGADDLALWPATGEIIYGTVGINTPITIPIDTGLTMTCFTDGLWYQTVRLY